MGRDWPIAEGCALRPADTGESGHRESRRNRAVHLHAKRRQSSLWEASMLNFVGCFQPLSRLSPTPTPGIPPLCRRYGVARVRERSFGM